MAIRDIKPTRSELIALKKRIKLSKNGHQLLKRKRDALFMEFRSLLQDAIRLRGEIDSGYLAAWHRIGLASAVDGTMGVNSAAFAVTSEPEIEVGSTNMMGVVVPTITGTRIRKTVEERGYGILGTSARIDEAAESYELLLESIVEAARVETSMRKILDEIEKTKRRVNALEFKVIPELEDAGKFIKLRLEEMEREEIFRLKRLKG